jgi:RNA polymerase sigma-70 factor (ECF subfamily)
MHPKRPARDTKNAGRQPSSTGHGLLEGNSASAWAALIDRIAEGDIGACGTFYDESSGLAFSLIVHILQDWEAAEDTLLELYDEVWARARRYDHQNRNPVSWFIELARRAALVRLGQQRQSRTPMRLPPLLPSPWTPVAASGPFHRERLQANRALAKLTQDQRAIIQLVYFGGFSAREVADHLGLPLQHVANEIQSAVQVLRDSLETEAASLDTCVLAV